MQQPKTALVTGSTSGIGKAIAQRLAAKGINILLHGLLEQKQGEAMAESLASQFNIACHFSNADLKDENAIYKMVEDFSARGNRVDILVNNAGIQYVESLESFPAQKWNDIIAINLSAAFHASKAVLPAMQQSGWGRIVNVASVHGMVGSIGKSAYCAAKHGLVGLTKVAALENANTGVTINAVCPGWVDTELVAGQIEARAQQSGVSIEQAREMLVTEKQPMAKMTPPESLAELVMFLCSDHGSTITGAVLPVDGGWTAQ